MCDSYMVPLVAVKVDGGDMSAEDVCASFMLTGKRK